MALDEFIAWFKEARASNGYIADVSLGTDEQQIW
jgi:hypothetical protein